jgi:hypothetical protein
MRAREAVYMQKITNSPVGLQFKVHFVLGNWKVWTMPKPGRNFEEVVHCKAVSVLHGKDNLGPLSVAKVIHNLYLVCRYKRIVRPLDGRTGKKERKTFHAACTCKQTPPSSWVVKKSTETPGWSAS